MRKGQIKIPAAHVTVENQNSLKFSAMDDKIMIDDKKIIVSINVIVFHHG